VGFDAISRQISVRIELHCRRFSWCHRELTVLGKNLRTTGDQKCPKCEHFVQGVKETPREETPSRKELSFSLRREVENGGFFLITNLFKKIIYCSKNNVAAYVNVKCITTRAQDPRGEK